MSFGLCGCSGKARPTGPYIRITFSSPSAGGLSACRGPRRGTEILAVRWGLGTSLRYQWLNAGACASRAAPPSKSHK